MVFVMIVCISYLGFLNALILAEFDQLQIQKRILVLSIQEQIKSRALEVKRVSVMGGPKADPIP